MKKLIVIFLLFRLSFAQAQDNFFIQSRKILDIFNLADQQGTLLTYEVMSQIFSDPLVNYKMLRKTIRCDMVACKKVIKEYYPQQAIAYRQLLQSLRLLYRYVKEHKECCRALHFHTQLLQDYQLAFNNPNIVQCVEMTPFLYGVAASKYKCRAYFKKITNDLVKVEKIEDKIHGDHSALKAHNYVYKIELIKLRNYIYHHNIYKFETRYF